jgi:K+-transporting ATPase KdpF subunit
MSAEYIMVGIVCVGVFAYLIYALLMPERL